MLVHSVWLQANTLIYEIGIGGYDPGNWLKRWTIVFTHSQPHTFFILGYWILSVLRESPLGKGNSDTGSSVMYYYLPLFTALRELLIQ